MKKVIFVLLILLVVSPVLKAQKNRFTSTFFGLSIDTPVHWLNPDTAVEMNRFNNSSFDKAALDKMLDAEHGIIPVLTLSRHEIDEARTPISVVSISIERTNANSLATLAFSQKQHIDQTMGSSPGFIYTLPFTTFTLNGVQALKTAVSYSQPHTGGALHIRIRSYFFLRSGYFIKVGMLDTDEEDETDLYNLMAEGIKFQ